MRMIASLALFLAASGVSAGAWLKEEGTGFSSFALVAQDSPLGLRVEGRAYVEYGLTPRLTVGANVLTGADGAGEALAFARLPLGPQERPNKLAVEIGAGAFGQGRSWRPLSKATLSYGRGFENAWGYGWVSVDASAEYRSGAADPTFKLAGTIGQSSGMTWRPMLEVELARTGARSSWLVAPGLLRDGPRDVTFVFQFERHSGSDRRYGLRLGLWRNF